MKGIAISLFLLSGVQSAVLAQSTRVEQFHHKHYIQAPSHRSPYISPYRSPSLYHGGGIGRPHRIISQRPRVEYRYAPRYNYYPRQRVYPQRVYQTPCAVQPSMPYIQRHYRVGQRIRELPYGSMEVIIDNRRYYQYEDVYFLPQRRSGVHMYLVVDF
jgi:hypothetical protein